MKANGAPWKEVKLGSILRYLDDRVEMDDEKEYLTITIKRRHGGLGDGSTGFNGVAAAASMSAQLRRGLEWTALPAVAQDT